MAWPNYVRNLPLSLSDCRHPAVLALMLLFARLSHRHRRRQRQRHRHGHRHGHGHVDTGTDTD
eukprot:7934383-Prorocentrum_lima.AAC.1